MDINVSQRNKTVVLKLHGRFDFSSHKEFREAVGKGLATADADDIEVDMAAVEYLDSSALGMLLNLREKAQTARKMVMLTNCQGTVKQVLAIASFGKLFTIN